MLLRHHPISFRTPSFIPATSLGSRHQHHHQRNVFVFSFTNIAHIGVCLLILFIDPALGSDHDEERKTVHLMSSNSSSQTVAITLGVTIPCAFIIGILWCYCMSKVCKTDQASLARPKLSRAHTASRELISPPMTPKPSRYIVEDLRSHYNAEVQAHSQYDVEAQHHHHHHHHQHHHRQEEEHDNDSFNDIPIHRYHSDSLEEVSGIPIEGTNMDSFNEDEDIQDSRAVPDIPHIREIHNVARDTHPPPPIHKYDSDTSDELPPVHSHRPKCKSLDDIRKKARRKVPLSSSETRMAPKKRTAPRYHYETDSFSSDPQDYSDMDDSDVTPERHKAQVLTEAELP